jgi:SAM-dependent methyltransferase
MRRDFEDRYHHVENEHWWFAGRRDLLSLMLRRANAGPACRVLDVGCSAGATIRRLQRDGYISVVGIDISPQAIERCRNQGLQEVHVMDGQAPDFPDGSFDVILASDVLEHVPDERAAVGAWFRLLRPGGLLIALVPAFMALWSAHDEANHHRKRYRLGELRACFEAGGFRTERASYWNFLLFLPAAALRLLQRFLPSSGAGDAELTVPAAPANWLFRTTLFIENRLLGAGISWPWGLSAMVAVRRPLAPAGQARAS